MAKIPERKPKTFFLNEKHELSLGEVPSGGGLPKLAPIHWASRAETLSTSLKDVQSRVTKSRDPLRDRHFFLLAEPVQAIKKESKDEKKAPDGTFEERPDYAGSLYSRVFQRLGVDLLQVNDDGSAVIHALPESMERLILTSSKLSDVGAREQSRWASIKGFGVIPSSVRADDQWLRGLPSAKPADVVIELQPLLSRSEAHDVLEAITSILQVEDDGKLSGTGTDYSGRRWYRGSVTRRALRQIVREFYSVQSVHPPLYSVAASGIDRGAPIERVVPNQKERKEGPQKRLPVVAVVDTGVPTDHIHLAPFLRGRYRSPVSPDRHLGDHGSRVASRIVFGDLNSYKETSAPQGGCQFYDVNVGITPTDIDDMYVVRAMEAIVSTAPDVRIFNLSFDSRKPLEQLSQGLRQANLYRVQDLDNFLFANDVLSVVAAGNSPPGVVPSTPYPKHYDEPEWGLGHWARSFNSITCGATVERLEGDGLVQELGWPSPFSRLGPGLCDSSKPDFVAHGGNWASTYRNVSGLGVWCSNERGLWEDVSGTSYAAPLLAREASFALDTLGQYCQHGASPFAVTLKAYLALSAIPPVSDERIKTLVARASGQGSASSKGLLVPNPQTVVMIWQGVIESPKDIVRVRVPIPREWLQAASSPHMRLVVSWDPPVNAAAHHVWACRKVNSRLRVNPDAHAMRFKRSPSNSYPLTNRVYDLKRLPKGETVKGDIWLVELSYEQIADYSPGIEFSLQQRVSFAAELWDDSEEPASPQGALQSLPIAQTMNRLSVPPTIVRNPVVIRV